MTHHHKPYRSIKQLPTLGNTVSAYIAKSQMLDAVSKKMQTLLDPRYQGHCRIANIRNQVAVIQVTHPALATRLRYELPALTQQLQHLGLDIQTLQLTIKPESSPPPAPTRQVTRPSNQASACLHTASRQIEDPDIKRALARLADSLTSKTNAK